MGRGLPPLRLGIGPSQGSTPNRVPDQEDTRVDEVIRLLEREHLIRVPVVLDGKLMGIVARRDVLFGYLKTTAPNWP